MNSRKAAAAVSAAGAVLIAGCAGGMSGGGFHAASPGGAAKNGQNISLSFTIPRGMPQFAQTQSNRRGTKSATRTSIRNPKYLSPGVFNGSVVLKIYQNGQPAAADQTFSIGFYGTDFICYAVPPTYSFELCYNTVNVYAPIGSDTFFAETYDSAKHLLSATPGLYTFYGSPPAAYTVPYSGTISIPTYAYVSSVEFITATPCTNPFATGFAFVDADGFFTLGPLANPVTLGVSSGFELNVYPSGAAQTYTFYNGLYAAYGFFEAAGDAAGQTGSLTATSPSGNVPMTVPRLYSVDHMGFAASTGGLFGYGLVSGSTTSFNCGQVPLLPYNAFLSNTPVTFSNPVAMTQDNIYALFVLDNGGSNPVVDIVFMNDLEVAPYLAVPVSQVTLPSTGGLGIAASGLTFKSYVINTDGSVQVVDYTNSIVYPFVYGGVFYNTAATGLTTPAGSDIAIIPAVGGDSIFISSYGNATVNEFDNANTMAPSQFSKSLTGVMVSNYGFPFTGAVLTTGVTADQANNFVAFRAVDSLFTAGNQTAIFACSGLPNCVQSGGPSADSLVGASFAGAGSLAAVYSQTGFLAGSGTNVLNISDATLVPGANFLSGLASPAARVIMAPDNSFAAVQQGAAFTFFTYPAGQNVGSITAPTATLWDGTIF